MKATLSVPATLLQALQQLVPGASNRTLRQMLRQGRIRVGGLICKIAGQQLQVGDIIEVGDPDGSEPTVHGIRILYQDDDLLVAHKPAGLLTVSTALEKERTAYAFLRSHVGESRTRQLFVVHRLDKFASGVLVFAKSRSIREKLRVLFRRHDVERKYWAVVEGRVAPDQGTVRSRLAQDKTGRMRSTLESVAGKSAVTHFRVLRRFSNLTALEVTLETGRKNQIRVHLSDMGHPIVGDRAYGSAMDPLGRMGLHAFVLGFRHPRSGKRVVFRTDVPPEFRRYLPSEELGRK